MIRENLQVSFIVGWNFFLAFFLNVKEELTIILLVLSVILTSIKIIQGILTIQKGKNKNE